MAADEINPPGAVCYRERLNAARGYCHRCGCVDVRYFRRIIADVTGDS